MNIRENKRIIVVLGMHRSGTSAIARSLKLLGADLGNRLMPPAASNNEKGFWEDADLNRLNIDLLDSISQNWDTLDIISDEEFKSDKLAAFRLRAVQLLREKTNLTHCFAFKDPRISILLPFWQNIFSKLNFAESYVISIRNPLSCVESLKSRDRFEREKSYYLWLEHVVPSVMQTSRKRRVVVDYDRMMDMPSVEIMRIARSLKLNIENNTEELKEYEEGFLDKSLRHNRFSIKDVREDPAAPAMVAKLYELLYQVSSDVLSLNSPKIQGFFKKASHQLKSMGPAFRYMTRQDRQIEALCQTSVHQTSQIVGLGKVAEERERKMENLLQATVGIGSQIQEMSQVVSQRDAHIGRLEEALSKLDNQLSNVHQTIAEDKGEIHKLQEAVAERDRESLDLKKSIAERVAEISRLREEIARRDIEIKASMTLLKEQERQSGIVATDLLNLSKNYDSIILSKAWKFGLVLRKIRHTLIPTGGFAFKLLNPIWKVAKNVLLGNGSVNIPNHSVAATHDSLPLISKENSRNYQREFPNEQGDDVKQVAQPEPISSRPQVNRPHVHRDEEDMALIGSSGLFDEGWYLLKNPDVASAKIDPMSHYLQSGGFERRDPSPNFSSGWYLDTNEDVRIARVNPLIHYLELGMREGRTKQPVSLLLTNAGTINIAKNRKENDIAVVLHLFYEDLYEEVRSYLRNLAHFDLYISMHKLSPGLKEKVFKSFHNAKIFFTENRGRDILPFICIYRTIRLLNYRYILKIHTKKSAYREDGDIWRNDIYGKLIGSNETVNAAILALKSDQSLGLLGPKGHVIDYRIYWGNNKKKTEDFAKRVGINIKENHSFNFVAGSMFWAKPEALQLLSLLPLGLQEYEPEPLGPDGTTVHALERFIGLAVEESGYSILEIDGQGNISDPRMNPIREFYPFGVADGSQIITEARTEKEKNLDMKETSHRTNDNIPNAQPDPGSMKSDAPNMPMLPGGIGSPEKLAVKLHKYLGKGQTIISISQSDYTQAVGGVEIKILDEQRTFNEKGINYIHLCPFHIPHQRLVSENEPLYIRIRCNGEAVGMTDRQILLFVLKKIAAKKVLDIIIHHTMGLDLILIDRILKEIGGKRGRFWLHDNFSICPCYTLLRNDLAYCGAPDMNSNACLICKHGETRRIQQPAFNRLFSDNDLTIVSPSKYSLRFWKEKTAYKSGSEKVVPHLSLNWIEKETPKTVRKGLRIGFLGYPVYWKGWDTWLRLVNIFFDDVRYEFYCFTFWPSTCDKMKWVNVSVTKTNRLGMVTALRDNGIDVAFLWSLCSETFSFTLYEALAAGCYCITCTESGNIQDYLKQDVTRGLVLEKEEDLFKLFGGNDLEKRVREYQKNGKPQGKLSILTEI